MKWTHGSAKEAAEEVADRICAWAKERGRARNPADGPEKGALLLPTGATPILLYEVLRERAAEGSLERTAWRSFNLDEYWPCRREDGLSFRWFMEQELFGPLQLVENQTGFLEGTCPEAQLDTHCAAYESAIRAAGGIELAVLGVGVNGHLAFNEPGTDTSSRTRRVRLSEATRSRPGFPGGMDGPSQALTVGLGTILEAQEIVVLAFGRAKQEALSRLAAGKVDTDWPVTCLLQHPQVRIHTDLQVP
ncbi:MAG: glucosamine-6-phosphate deaminase [Planctomycetota bacterium]